MIVGITERGDAGIDFSWIERCDNTDFSILITKCVHNEKFQEEVMKHPRTIVHATITGMGCSLIEPNVGDWMHSVKGLRQLVDKIGQDRCVLRIDPIIPTVHHMKNVLKILYHMMGYIKRVRFSFIDNYKHIKDRGMILDWNTFNPPLENINYALDTLYTYKDIFEFESCAEDINVAWIQNIGCISEKDFKVFGIVPDSLEQGNQRKLCKCLACKTELLTNRKQCPNGCLYCYWK